MQGSHVPLPPQVQQLLEQEVLERFLRYVKVHTTSDPRSATSPSTARQLDLLRLLESELRELDVPEVTFDEAGFVYARLPARGTSRGTPFGLLAHVDTSPDQPGDNVLPQLHTAWSGAPIRFPEDPTLVLDPQHEPELAHFIGDTIITASGRTLLGADDKAGIAEIMAAVAAFRAFPELPHPEITICFTRDEEIGRGVDGIDLKRLPKFCYTMDGGYPGELEDECFDAWQIVCRFTGRGVHPGYAKGKMINAAGCAARFVAALPEAEAPEHTSGREGFFHLTHLEGDHEQARVELIIRDFESSKNEARIALLRSLAAWFEQRHHGITVHVEASHQYRNMREFLAPYPQVVEIARRAIEATGTPVIRRAIRGGTDGSRLSELGHPTPNIFAGGLLFHSRKEWIALSSMRKASEAIVHLGRLWAMDDCEI